MTDALRLQAAWLAGLIDGEGSVGLVISRTNSAGTPVIMSPAVQMSMTCKRTIDVAVDVIHALGATAVGYSYREKDPAKHKDAHYLRLNRIGSIQQVGRWVRPFSVTKRPQWDALLEFVDRRIARAGLDAHGRIRRGGPIKGRAYEERDVELAQILRGLNSRGPSAKRKEAAWLAKLYQA